MRQGKIYYNKAEWQILSLPLFLINFYIFTSLLLFMISPMISEAHNAFWSIAYGIAAMLCFSFGYIWTSRRAFHHARQAKPSRFWLNSAVLAMCVANLIYMLPMLWFAFSYYGFQSFNDMINDLGQNYRSKDRFIEELGYRNIGLIYTILNIFAFTQIVPYVLLMFCSERLKNLTIFAIVISGVVTIMFYLSIGTMAGIFYIAVLVGCGWLARRSRLALYSGHTIEALTMQRRRFLIVMAILGAAFFCFMVIILSSRLERDIVVTLPFHYDYDSPIYSIFGRRIGDGFGIALSYISAGWYGLGNSFMLEFEWTEFRSFSRVFTTYVNRFSGIDTDLAPLSYPVRQESITGYPAFAYWHTIFPWFASDFTFAGTLLIFVGFGAVYGWSWVTAVREGCLVSVSLFSLLTIGALFINANSQILDNKILSLALLAFLMSLPIRKFVSYMVKN
jgi:hypothetical protein